MLLSLHSLYLIITVMTLGLKSHDLYGVPNEINDDDDDDDRVRQSPLGILCIVRPLHNGRI